jgi:hypothetical protein
MLSVAACSEGRVTPAGVVSDSAGIRIVTHETLEGPALQVPREPVLRLGWAESDPQFKEVVAGTVLSSGTVAVFDAGLSTLFLIAPDGSTAAPIGRAGECSSDSH